MARIGIVRRGIAYEIQVWNCRYAKSYRAYSLEFMAFAGGEGIYTVVVRRSVAHFLPKL